MDSTIYYGVYLPNETIKDTELNVFQDKMEALKLMKKNKKARFKAFQFYHEAAEFAINGSECPNNNSHTVDGVLYGKKPIENNVQQIGEKASPFKGPKPQELVELRKTIEAGNYRLVKEMIWQNPRYLVSSGDTPSILQEGSRYNALHVSAKARNATMAELILSTISNIEFIKLLYGDDNDENAQDRSHVLLDLYLNTPNKGNNETPLHFAAKYGAVDVVEVLVSHSQCDKTLKNKYGQTAQEIICERADDTSIETKRKISILLQENYYVPVLRTEDNSLPPTVGEPFSPTSPPIINKDPLSPRLEIHAYAGPMDKKDAQEFRKVWKTPPRSLKFNQSTPELVNLRFKDPEKGLERIGKQLAEKYSVSWKEYWPFLDSFVDIASVDGLNLLEKHLMQKLPMKMIRKSPTNNNNSQHEQSLMTKLCSAFSTLTLCDNDENIVQSDNLVPLVHIERACQVFANRITNILLYILCEYDNIVAVLETEIKHLELAIQSYMDDVRFSCINFQKVHPRLGALIGNKLLKSIKMEARESLCDRIENLLENVIKSLDCFSSDDEGSMHLKEIIAQRKPTIYRKQMICLIQFILIILLQNSNYNDDNDDCDDWEKCASCLCVYHVRKTKKSSLSRNSSIKYKNSKFYMRNGTDCISRKLFFDDDNSASNELNNSLVTNHCDSSSDDEFYTPPSSPSLLYDESQSSSSDCEEFVDTELPKIDVFIEGFCPTRTDYAVYNALKQSDCTINKDKYPNIYKWRHNISLYTDSERKGWPSPNHVIKTEQIQTPPPTTNVTQFDGICEMSTPTKSWLRITGANSPRWRLK